MKVSVRYECKAAKIQDRDGCEKSKGACEGLTVRVEASTDYKMDQDTASITPSSVSANLEKLMEQRN